MEENFNKENGCKILKKMAENLQKKDRKCKEKTDRKFKENDKKLKEQIGRKF